LKKLKICIFLYNLDKKMACFFPCLAVQRWPFKPHAAAEGLKTTALRRSGAFEKPALQRCTLQDEHSAARAQNY
jgi:hypothetical protein